MFKIAQNSQKFTFDTGIACRQMHYMLDTCIFNWVLDGSIQMEQLRAEYQYFITHIQRDELDRETSGQRKKQLLKVLNTINPQCIHTESMVLGISRLGMCRLSGDDFFEKFISFLNKINNNKRNNGKDALIAEAAFKNNLTLMTADRDLKTVAENFNCSVRFYQKSTLQECRRPSVLIASILG